MNAATVSLIVMALFFLGTPLVPLMGLWAVLISYFVQDLSLANLSQTAFSGLSNFALLAFPLFILTGDFCLAGGIAQRLTEMAQALVGWVRGGLAMVALVACGLFAAINGSNVATTAAIGQIMISDMARRGYDRTFTAATVASGGTVGVIIPPSISFIVYGAVMMVSPVDLFVSGIIPGILMVVAMCIAVRVVSRLKPDWIPKDTTPFSFRRVVGATMAARWGLLAIALPLAGVYMGWFSPTEAAGVTVAYTFLAGWLLTRQLSLRKTPEVIFRSAQITGLLAPMLAFSIVLQQNLSLLGIADAVEKLLTGFGGRWVVTAAIMGIILVVGTFFESVPNIIMTAPILAPAAYAVGIDPVQFAMIFIIGDTIGFITMPYGLNLFVASSITAIPYMRIAVVALWYVAALIVPWVLVAVFPDLSLGLLRMMERFRQ
jgi:C4-dicarboxylate transporter DctM subunit